MKLICSDVPAIMIIAAAMVMVSVLFFTIYYSGSIYKNLCIYKKILQPPYVCTLIASSGSFSSMYLLILDLARSFRYDTSLLTMANPTCNTYVILLWVYPLLQSSCTLSLLHCMWCVQLL